MRRWVVPAAFAVAAATSAAHAADVIGVALRDPSSRHVLVAIYAVLRTLVALAFAAFTVQRAEPRRRSRDPVAFVACAIAIVAVLVVSPPTRGTSGTVLAAGDLVAVAGCVWLLVSVLALGRCFGVLPEARGLVRRGPYRFVRHPVYLGEIAALAGLTIAAPAPWNLAVFVLFVAAQVVRTHLEERALIDAFPDYARYAQATGRLVPALGKRPSGQPVAGSGTSASPNLV